jgi:hypothetical protein
MHESNGFLARKLGITAQLTLSPSVRYWPLCDVIDLKQFSMYPYRLSCAQSGL